MFKNDNTSFHPLLRLQVELYGQYPPIVKMDNNLGILKACKCEKKVEVVPFAAV